MNDKGKSPATSGKYVGVFIPQAHHDALRRAAAAIDRPISFILRELIKTYVDKNQTAIKELRRM